MASTFLDLRRKLTCSLDIGRNYVAGTDVGRPIRSFCFAIWHVPWRGIQAMTFVGSLFAVFPIGCAFSEMAAAILHFGVTFTCFHYIKKGKNNRRLALLTSCQTLHITGSLSLFVCVVSGLWGGRFFSKPDRVKRLAVMNFRTDRTSLRGYGSPKGISRQLRHFSSSPSSFSLGGNALVCRYYHYNLDQTAKSNGDGRRFSTLEWILRMWCRSLFPGLDTSSFSFFHHRVEDLLWSIHFAGDYARL